MTRSDLMRRIRSRGNASTELAMARLLRRHGVTGWRRHAKVLGIRPDFVFRKTKIAVFVDGCFWHGCHEHVQLEKLSSRYWRDKILSNWYRDKKQNRILSQAGWKVKRIWEHDLRKGRENVDLSVIK